MSELSALCAVFYLCIFYLCQLKFFTCEIFTYEFLLMYFFTCVNSSFLPVIFLLVFFLWIFLCQLKFFTCDILLVIFSLMDLFFYTSDFFPPQIVSEKGRKVCFSKIIDCHPSKYCSLFSLAFYMRFTPSGNVPKIYFQSNLLNLVNSKSITFSKLAQKVKLLRIET